MFKVKILEDLKKVVEHLGYESTDIVLSIPKNPEFGEYTANIALQLAKQKESKDKQSAVEIANEILSKLRDLSYLEKVEVAGGGFINFYIKPDALLESLRKVCDYASLVNPEIEVEGEEKKKILIEFAHPNTHKQFHIGHLRNITLGESICRLLESTGNKIWRVNYQGDIGLHVAKAIWGLIQICHAELDSASKSKILKQVQDDKIGKKIEFLGKAYVLGANKYEEDEDVKKEIQEINKQLYQRDSKVVPLWEKTRQWSLDYFDLIYKKLGTRFDQFVFESEVEEKGSAIVKDNIDKVFEHDQGAVIFPGEKYGLHSRVFITSAGNPTYEAKDLGRAQVEKAAFPFDLAIHVVAVDQSGYFQVMFKALKMVDSDLIGKNQHLAYGMVKLSSGKMASRTGDVITFDWLFDEVKKKVEQIMNSPRHFELGSESQKRSRNEFGMTKEEKEQIINIVSMAAIKFSMLKYAPQTDITFDIEKSVSLSGDSGPYIQYTYARAKSVLRNAQYDYDVDLPHSEKHPHKVEKDLEKEERLILQKIEHFETIVSDAAENLHPNVIAAYLLELSSLFNLFYQKHPIIKGENTEFRLALTCSVAVILKQGLYLLGIESPERM